MEHVSEALSALVESDAEPLSDDAREAIREGLSAARALHQAEVERHRFVRDAARRPSATGLSVRRHAWL